MSDDFKPTTHHINNQNLNLVCIAAGRWRISLLNEKGEVVRHKEVMFSGDKAELVQSIWFKPLRWQ